MKLLMKSKFPDWVINIVLLDCRALKNGTFYQILVLLIESQIIHYIFRR